MANKEINVDDILQKIDRELNHANDPVLEQIVNCQEPVFQEKDHYTLQELCQFYDEEFIEKAFWAILRRIPDTSGREFYLRALRNGERSKERIIAMIRYSDKEKKKISKSAEVWENIIFLIFFSRAVY